jgi:hypothetical protein
MAGTAAIALSAFAFRPALAVPSTTSTSFTVSTATVETIIDTPVTKQVNTFSTELTAQMEGGPVLYDQTFPVPFADPIFQSAIVRQSMSATLASVKAIRLRPAARSVAHHFSSPQAA